MTDTLAAKYQPDEVESHWYDFWIEGGYFHADESSDKEPYTIVIPPPNVTGKLHMGHALFVTIQDLLIRYKRMAGFEALWLPGVDHAGIATQVVVEREIAKEGLTRHDLGREKFLERVWAWKEQSGGKITEQLKVMGASCDWERERFTMDEGLSHAVREVFVRLYREDLLYRGERLVNWDPKAQTVLSDLEVDQEEEDGFLWHIAYPIEGTDRQIVVATTRPETLVGDTAVAVHPDDERYQDIIGKKVLLPLTDRKIPIIADGIVANPEFGTGAVKITPAHDFNDFETGLRNDLERIQVIGLDARMNDNAPEAYQGLDRFEARKRMVADLEAAGLLVKVDPHKFMPSRSQRSGQIVEPMLLPQWWVKADVLAKPAIEAVETGKTRIIPEMWEKTYFHWMRNIRDWCISRQLWWGHQIPAWYRKDDPNIAIHDDGTIVIGAGATPYVASSAQEAAEAAGTSELVQEPDVLDTWFSSGLWAFSTLGWPHDNPALSKFYPTQVMETGYDILFFWVARMMMFGIHFMGEVPFDTVFLHAMVQDKHGRKMSKVKGNVIDPLHVVRGVKPEDLGETEREMCSVLFEDYPEGISAQGSDALRFSLAMYAAQGRNIRLDLKRVEGYRAFFNKIWQASRFTLMNVEGKDILAYGSSTGRPPVDASTLELPDYWILTRLQQVVMSVTAAIDAFELNNAAQTLYDFFWNEFCSWYIEFAKPAMHNSEETDETTVFNTRSVLLHVLETSLRLLHPFAPYVTEEIWQALPKDPASPDSICIAPWPEPDTDFLFEQESEDAARLIEVVSALRNLRGEANIKPSQPIPKVLAFTDDDDAHRILEAGRIHIRRLAKIEAIEFHPASEPRPGTSATTVGSGIELVVPLAGLIDLDEERARIQKSIDKLDKDIAHVSKKLGNPKFVERAPDHIVQGERDKLAGLEADKAKLIAGLDRLQ